MNNKTNKPRGIKPATGSQRFKFPFRKKTRVQFPQVKGKTLEFVELWLESDDNHIELGFTDKTALHLDLEAGFSVGADFADWKTHNWRGIKAWPKMRSPSLQG
jgi:hypothetical protein